MNRADVAWDGIDIRPQACTGVKEFRKADFLKVTPTTKYDVVMSNPPFSLAMEFVEHSMKFAPVVVMLLRLAFLESAGRNSFLRVNTPDV